MSFSVDYSLVMFTLEWVFLNNPKVLHVYESDICGESQLNTDHANKRQ